MRKLAKLWLAISALALAGCVTPTKPTSDPEVITNHKTVTYPPIR